MAVGGIGRYIGRGQYPRLETKPLVHTSVEASRFSGVHCDLWAIISNLLLRLARCPVTDITCVVSEQLSNIIRGRASSFETHWRSDLPDMDLFNDWQDFFSPIEFTP